MLPLRLIGADGALTRETTMTETTMTEVTIVPADTSLYGAVYEADAVSGAAHEIARLLDNLRNTMAPRNREWVTETVAHLTALAQDALDRADALFYEVAAITATWVEALEDAEYLAEDDDEEEIDGTPSYLHRYGLLPLRGEEEEEVVCHDCGDPAQGTGECIYSRCDCRGRVDLCTACGTNEHHRLYGDEWRPYGS